MDAFQVTASKEQRVCHYRKLFITTEGDIYPCCQRPEHTLIGNIKDPNISDVIKNKEILCECSAFKSIKQTADDKINLNYMNIELSLLCQAHCLVCYTLSPYWKGEYDLYDNLEKVIDEFTPKIIIVQGGEVLVQEKSLEWLVHLKDKHPEITLQLVTNLNVDMSKLELIEKLFDTITVSFMGFQPETYNAVVGLNIEKTLNMLEALFKNNKVKIRLKFVETPSSLHEAPMFLEWALTQNPEKIYMHDSDVELRVNKAEGYHAYWEELYRKTGDKMRKVLMKNLELIQSKPNYISFFKNNSAYYKITPQFLCDNNLNKNISII